MPSFVPRGLEPYKKRDQWEQRVAELRAAVRGGRAARIARAAERVRAAALAVVKARRSLLHRPTEASDEVRRQLANLDRKAAGWAVRPAEEIVRAYTADPNAQ